jgi:hypothetical protein
MGDKPKLVKVLVEHDEMPAEEGPNSWGGWRLYSFNTRHRSFRHPNTFDDEDIARGLEQGQVFSLECYQHGPGNTHWALSGEQPLLLQCQWDNRKGAGWLIMEDDYEFADREAAAASARGFLETYNDWTNGHVFQFTFPEDDERETHGGLIGLSDLMHGLIDVLEEDEEPEFVNDDTGSFYRQWQRIKDERDHARENVELPDPAGTSGGV